MGDRVAAGEGGRANVPRSAPGTGARLDCTRIQVSNSSRAREGGRGPRRTVNS